MNDQIARNDNGRPAGTFVTGVVKTVLTLVYPRDLIQSYYLPTRIDILLNRRPASKKVQFEHAWNSRDKSPNIIIKDDDYLTFIRNPRTDGTDCIRGKVGFTNGLHIWKINWPTDQRGTHAVVGVATQNAILQAEVYCNLLGKDDLSWGWDLGSSDLYHDFRNNTTSKYPVNLKRSEFLLVPETFLVVLDMDEGTLSFIVEGKYLGVAFRGLKGKKLFPIVNSVWGNCKISMTYIGGLDHEPISLMELCRYNIRQQIGKQNKEDFFMNLNLPQPLRMYLH